MRLSVGILAGGQSKRFWPLEEKNLFEFFGVPLIIYQIKRYAFFLKGLGIEPEFTIITNEFNYKEIKSVLEKSALKKINLEIQKLPDQYGAVLALTEKINLAQPLLIVNSNDIISEKLINTFIKKIPEKEIVLSATSVNQYFPGGYLVTKAGGQEIERIWEKPPEKKVPGELNLFRFVLDYFADPKKLVKCIKDNPDTQDYEGVINLTLKECTSTYALNSDAFTSLKYPWHILEAMNIFLDNIKDRNIKATEIDPTSVIQGNVFIEEGVKIGSFVKIVGPCYIGKNTILGDYSLVRHSHIGRNSLIGAHSEVARSYLGNEVLLHRNYVGDSILSAGVGFGANAVTANWRFDNQTIKAKINDVKIDTNMPKLGAIVGKNVRVGVGALLMPGVRVEKNALILPGTTAFKDITVNQT